MPGNQNIGQGGGKRAWYGVRSIFWVAGAVALLGFGVIFGIGLDLATRPKRELAALLQPPAPVRPSPGRVQPRIGIQPETGATPSILEKPSAVPEVIAPRPRAEPALARNAVTSPASAAQAVIAIVIDDMGLDRTRSLKVIDLKGPLTLSLMTYADDLQGLVARARAGGHEIMAHLPMEPIDPKENPGPGALRANMDAPSIRRVLAADLDGWSGYVGVNNHMGSRFTKNREHMGIVMEELKARGLLWLDSKTIGDSAGPAAAKAAGVPFLERDVFLDNAETVEAVTAQLEQLAATAKAKGSAIAIGHPHDSTFAALQAWLPGLAARGIALAPVTEILKRRTAGQSWAPG
ncbi:MAG: divergent polysaccharide deacetylase family protein [Rhodospirillaceae bacterium]|nr:divergent polysaccharide deacetylase family protein [Rhodospirillaceae bacterium]